MVKCLFSKIFKYLSINVIFDILWNVMSKNEVPTLKSHFWRFFKIIILHKCLLYLTKKKTQHRRECIFFNFHALSSLRNFYKNMEINKRFDTCLIDSFWNIMSLWRLQRFIFFFPPTKLFSVIHDAIFYKCLSSKLLEKLLFYCF